MKKSKKPESFMPSPYYEGGDKALHKFIVNEMKYPPDAVKHNIEGIVSIKISIDMNGKVFKGEILKGLGHGCDEEALRLVKLLKYHPVKLRNMKATFHKTLNISFNLKDFKAKAVEMKINYTEVKSPETPDKPAAPAPATITYKIKLN